MPRDLLAELTAFYQSQREAIDRLHREGASGRKVVEALSDLTDQVILMAVDRVGLFPGGSGALVAIGGYGRRELSPLSDIDLMFLAPSDRTPASTVSSLLCLLWDIGLKVGHAVRTIADCVTLAKADMIIATSMAEARFLTGNRPLFDHFQKTFLDKIVYRDFKVSMLRTNRAQADRWRSPYLAEPNVKTSPGGLRDIHYMRWVALSCYRTNSLSQLREWGKLTILEDQRLTDAQDFIWRVRNQLHFKRSDDHLTAERQDEIALFMGFENRERFMRHYYRHAEAIAEITTSVIDEAVPKSAWQSLLQRFTKKYVSPGFYLYPDEIVPAFSPPDYLFSDENLLWLFLLAKEWKKRIPRWVIEALHPLKQTVQEPVSLSPSVQTLFRRLLAVPGNLAGTLRKMHQTGVLWRILPELSHIEGRVQESRSHFFSTDEHTFQAIDELEKIIDDPRLGKIYTEIRRKDILHLALLLHDAGKGEGGDHSRRGSEMADAVSRRLAFTDEERVLLVLLVKHHLLFSEVAFYRDFTNEPILLTFARTIGRPETLAMLLVLTVADIRAVSPGTWSSWKGELLLKLYNEAKVVLSGEEDLGKGPGESETMRLRLDETTQGQYPDIWRFPVLQALTPRYLSVTPFEKIKTDLEALYRLFTQPIQVSARYDPATGTTDYTFYTTDAPALFLKMTGVLAARGFSIMSAQVFTHTNGMVVDTFSVMDPYTEGPPRPTMTDAILSDIKHVLAGVETIETLFQKGRRYPRGSLRMNPKMPIQVEVDNESSHTFTIIDIFAPDFPGLLYQIAKTIDEAGLSVHSARIATRLDQIVDVFYVHSTEHQKITDPEVLQALKSHLVHNIKAAQQAYKSAPIDTQRLQ